METFFPHIALGVVVLVVLMISMGWIDHRLPDKHFTSLRWIVLIVFSLRAAYILIWILRLQFTGIELPETTWFRRICDPCFISLLLLKFTAFFAGLGIVVGAVISRRRIWKFVILWLLLTIGYWNFDAGDTFERYVEGRFRLHHAGIESVIRESRELIAKQRTNPKLVLDTSEKPKMTPAISRLDPGFIVVTDKKVKIDLWIANVSLDPRELVSGHPWIGLVDWEGYEVYAEGERPEEDVSLRTKIVEGLYWKKVDPNKVADECP